MGDLRTVPPWRHRFPKVNLNNSAMQHARIFKCGVWGFHVPSFHLCYFEGNLLHDLWPLRNPGCFDRGWAPATTPLVLRWHQGRGVVNPNLLLGPPISRPHLTGQSVNSRNLQVLCVTAESRKSWPRPSQLQAEVYAGVKLGMFACKSVTDTALPPFRPKVFRSSESAHFHN